MNAIAKWIGGASLAVIVLVSGAMFAGRTLEAQDVEPAGERWIDSHPVLGEDPQASELTDGEQSENSYGGFDPVDPEVIAQAVVQEVPSFDPDDPFVIKRVLPIDGPIKYGEWHWDDEGVPDGPLVVTVDIQARVISVFRDGYEIGAAAALLGTPAHPTPPGVFPILTKERHNVSEKYNNAPMPWTLRLTWDGIAIHGGSEVELGYASHGCVGVPDEFVSRLYDIAKIGDVVIITDGQTAGVGSSLVSDS